MNYYEITFKHNSKPLYEYMRVAAGENEEEAIRDLVVNYTFGITKLKKIVKTKSRNYDAQCERDMAVTREQQELDRLNKILHKVNDDFEPAH